MAVAKAPVGVGVEFGGSAGAAKGDPRAQLEQALRALEPFELCSPVVRRVNASGFATEDVLSRMLTRLQRHRVEASSLLVDLGCGAAGASLWLAERTGAR